MKKTLSMINIMLILSITIVIVFIFEKPAFADVGSFESYDSFSSSDWGSDWSSYDYDYDYDYGYDHSYSYYGGGGSLFGTAFVIIFFIIIFIILRNAKGNNRKYINSMKNIDRREVKTNASNEILIENQVKAIDELFNKDEFIAWSKDVFVKLQEAWMNREWDSIRHFESNELFEMHKKQLQGYIDNHQINMMERICVKSAYLSNFTQSGDKDILTIVLNSKMIDYIINDETREVIKGDTTTERHSTYKLVFVRKTGIKTKPGMQTVDTKNCPNCGAPTEITSSGKCEYCGSVITTGEFNWVLSNLEKI